MAKSAPKSPAPDDATSAKTAVIPRPRPQWVVAAVLLVGLGGVARLGWEYLHSSMAFSGRYQLSADVIHVLPETTPAWIRSDVKGEVLRHADLLHSASLLDDPGELHQRLVGAFELHPWVQQVEKVEFVGPKQIDIQVRYREPIAVVAMAGGSPQRELFVVDLYAMRLPDGDFTEIEKSYLPRIVGIEGRPPVGEPWTDPQVMGAVRLAARLKSVWDRYRLLEIVPAGPELTRSERYAIYELRTTGGTLIHWGAAPDQGPPGESSFEEKLERLARYIEEYGPLDSVSGPEQIDVRRTLSVKVSAIEEHPSPDTATR